MEKPQKSIQSIQTILTIIALWGVMLTGCQNPLTPLPQTTVQAQAGYGKVSISLGDEIENVIENVSRTVYPGRSGLTCVYTFTKTGGQPQTLTPTSGSFTLEYGEWTVEVKAYAGTVSLENLAAQGTKTFTVDAAAQAVTVELAGIDNTGTGTFSYRIQYPDAVSLSEFAVEKWPEKTPLTLAPPTTSGGVTTIAGTNSSVPAGFYFVTLRLVKDGRYSGRNEVVHIYDKLTSEFGSESEPVEFSAEDFNAAPLTGGVWADGNITGANQENWYSFTATANTQVIHVDFDTLDSGNGVNVQLYDSDGAPAGSQTRLYGVTPSLSLTLTNGQAYTVQVTSYYDSYYPIIYTGTYRIAFNDAALPPAIALPGTATPLTVDTWAPGDFSGVNTNWYSFTATAEKQYIHVGNFSRTGYFESFGVNVQLYDSAGNIITVDSYGVEINGKSLNGSPDSFISKTLNSGDTYYIKATRSGAGVDAGTYRIAYSAGILPPGITSANLNAAGNWVTGNITNTNRANWYTFTATAARQYIHLRNFSSTDINLNISIYNSAGISQGGGGGYDSEYNYFSPYAQLTVNESYYMVVFPQLDDGPLGSYQIAFNDREIPPGITPTPLTSNVWTNGSITGDIWVQWYKFTATAAEQYIHVDVGTLNVMYVQLFNVTTGELVGNNDHLDVAGHTVEKETIYNSKYFTKQLTVGQEYYIKVVPSSSGGTYRIAFKSSDSPPMMRLASNTWANGSVSTTNPESWYVFRASAGMQYIHVSFGTLLSGNGVNVQVRDSGGNVVGTTTTRLYGDTHSNLYTTRTLIPENEYYIVVTPHSTNGTFRIAFNNSWLPPGVQELTAGVWANGSVYASSPNWYSFTATASAPHYIHLGNFSGGDFIYNGVNIQLYNSSGAAVGNKQTNLVGGTSFVTSSLTNGYVYYVQVMSYNASFRGAYQITFSGSIAPPGIPALTADTWANGSLAGSMANWYSFEATASTHYIHVGNFDTTDFAGNGVYVQVYNSSGATVVSNTRLYSGRVLSSSPLTNGDTYYIVSVHRVTNFQKSRSLKTSEI